MRLEFKRIHYILAAVAFLVAAATYFATMQPTIPFWDCGEFIAAAAKLQVSHPPGAPFWMIVAHVGAWLVPITDLAAKYNALSALCGALSSMFLYLIAVKMIRLWRGEPENIADAIILFSGSLIAALSFTWSDSVWFNSTEFIVFSPGLLFIALMIWLAMTWQERADQPGNERYLMLIAFFIGLSMGAHQMSMLAFFPVWAIVYYRHWKQVTTRSFLSMVGLGVIFFIYIFKVVLNGLVTWAGSGMGIISALIIIAILGGIYYTSRVMPKSSPNRGFLNLLLWGGAMVLLGYSVYPYALIRGGQNTPMDEGAPSTFQKLAEYISREQYGTVSLSDEFVHRRLPQQKDDHAATWDENQYSGDLDFFWKYQTNIMYHRYLGWNFIGRTTDDKGAGVDFFKTWAIPFMLGLFGLYWHFKRDPKRALTMLGAFIIMGYLTCWYQNQQDPQPRERDYFYVGAFFVYALWIGIGSVGILEWIRERYDSWDNQKMTYALASATCLLLIFGPINQCIGVAGLIQGQPFKQSSKWAEYSRKHNWIPWEYAYNILQSCEPNAILFTYGDNDTFPLWCIQDLYGVRQDVRIVQLQLATMMWNVKQIGQKNDWGTSGVDLTLFTPLRLALSSDDSTYLAVERARDWTKPFNIPITDEQARWIMGDSSAKGTTMSWKPKMDASSDFLVADIVSNNLGKRPICYSVTVPEYSRANLGKYLMFEGLTARVTPFEQPQDKTGLGGGIQPARYAEAIFNYPATPHHEPSRGMILRTYSDPEANRSAMDDEYSLSYRYEFMRLANYYVEHGDMPNARRSLDTMEARIPLHQVDLDYSFASYVADLADKAGDWLLTAKYAKAGVEKLKVQMQEPDSREASQGFEATYQLGNLEMRAGQFDEARKQFESIAGQSKPEEKVFLSLKIDECDARKLESQKQYDSAYHKFSTIIASYSQSPGASSELQDLKNHLEFDSILSKQK